MVMMTMATNSHDGPGVVHCYYCYYYYCFDGHVHHTHDDCILVDLTQFHFAGLLSKLKTPMKKRMLAILGREVAALV